MSDRTTGKDTFDDDAPTGKGKAGITVGQEDLLDSVGSCGNHQPKRSSPIHDVTNVLTEYI